MKFIKLTLCLTNKPVLIRIDRIKSVEATTYEDKPSCYLYLFQPHTESGIELLNVWESIDHIHGLLK